MTRISMLLLMMCLAATGWAQKFAHPGLLHGTDDIERMTRLIERKYPVAFVSYEKLLADSRSSADYKPRGPFDIIARDGVYQSRRKPSEDDCAAAYYNALLWAVTKDDAHGRKAMEIIRLYADSLKCITGTEAPLCAGLQGFMLLNACELMRYMPRMQSEGTDTMMSTWTKLDTRNVERMIKYVFVPHIDEFRKAAPCTNGSWGIAVNKLRIAVAVFTEDRKMLREALEYHCGTNEQGRNDNGSLANYIGVSGQCQESGRDQRWVMTSLGSMAEFCEVAWNQGLDIYGEKENRLLSGYEYMCKANLGFEVPFEQWKDKSGKYSQWKVICEAGMGEWRNVLEIAYNHYVGRKDLKMPYTAMALRHVRPEGTGNQCDNAGYGSLTFLRDTPCDLVTTSPGMRLILHSETRDYDPVAEPVIRMAGAENLTLAKTMDCWTEYWDMKPAGMKDGMYEYRPGEAVSRNGFDFGSAKATTTFIIYGNLDIEKELRYCRSQIRRTWAQLRGDGSEPVDSSRTITGIAPYDSIWERTYADRDEWKGVFWEGVRSENVTGDLAARLAEAGKAMSTKAIAARNDTTLARNCAWRIYGYASQYAGTKDADARRRAEQAADWYLKNLPYDMIPYWSFNSPVRLKIHRDACSACIAASGLLTLSKALASGTQDERSKAEGYRAAALRMLIELSSDRYQSRDSKPSLLLHSVGDMYSGTQMDYSLIMADYYYIEALGKARNN
ncbi:MAG: alginate lyase family protein [Bacteroidaceae bacterium]|nr:alginate lyase family protein [Bacteroidaceae bacterium]